jgi:hypothetical protein
VTFKGQFFGSTPPTSLAITIGSQICLSPSWISESEVSCVTPPVPTDGSPVSDMPITVIVNGQSSGSTPLGILTGTDGFRYGLVDCNAACGYNQACDDTTGSCSLCVPGWVGSDCDIFAVLLESANGQLIRIAESPGFASENGALSMSLRESPGSASVTFRLDATIPGEVTIDPPVVTFSTTNFATPQQIMLRAVDDAVKDGNRTLIISPTVVSGTGRFKQASAKPAVGVFTIDAFPTITSFTPSAVPLAGRVNVTITGDHWDEWVEVWFEKIRVGEFKVKRPANVTGSTLALGVLQSSSGNLFEPSLSGSVTFFVENSHVTGASDGYQKVTIVNLFTRTRGADDTLMYATENCPTPGEFGFGDDCKPCPEGGECPGGYRIWPKEGYWNPGEGSG